MTALLDDAADSRIGEYVRHDQNNVFAALAPHGGEMEPETERQAFVCADAIRDCSAWAYCGYRDEGRAFDRYHTKSTRIKPRDYEFLGDLFTAPITHAVSFHGFDTEGYDVDPDIYIGGRIDREIQATVAEAIEMDTGFDTMVATRGDDLYKDLAGSSRSNIVNRVGELGGLQLEQTIEVRRDAGDTIARNTGIVLNQVTT